ncbi:hypothetical protein TNCV_2120501 [Trichonephila clavipes]|nr:hypothetical protein TNCV_2120501 [Trichonephila clavipes]
MIDTIWRAVTLLTIQNCFKKLGLPRLGLVDAYDTLMKCNAEPTRWEALPVQALTFDEYENVEIGIAVWGTLSDA